jgi:hypothetical protein
MDLDTPPVTPSELIDFTVSSAPFVLAIGGMLVGSLNPYADLAIPFGAISFGEACIGLIDYDKRSKRMAHGLLHIAGATAGSLIYATGLELPLMDAISMGGMREIGPALPFVGQAIIGLATASFSLGKAIYNDMRKR